MILKSMEIMEYKKYLREMLTFILEKNDILLVF